MHKNKLVACVKANGKILREFGEEVKIPFGSEFSVLLKNLNDTKVSVSIFIDGQDVAFGNNFIIDPKQETEITRFVKDLGKGNKFKFIERSSSIEESRGIKTEDGLIRIEFEFEKQIINENVIVNRRVQYHNHQPMYSPFWYSSNIIYGTSIGDNITNSVSSVKASGSINDTTRSVNTCFTTTDSCIEEPGITVPGSISNQQFNEYTGIFNGDGNKNTIIFKLSGVNTSGIQIQQPIDVKMNAKCVTCGRVNKATSKFCSNCGTSLEII